MSKVLVHEDAGKCLSLRVRRIQFSEDDERGAFLYVRNRDAEAFILLGKNLVRDLRDTLDDILGE